MTVTTYRHDDIHARIWYPVIAGVLLIAVLAEMGLIGAGA